jgi:hypothetical protein
VVRAQIRTGTWRRSEVKEGKKVVGLLITILVAALAYLLLVALTGSTIVGIVAAILILISGIPSGGFGFGSRWGGGGRAAP